MTYIRKMKDWTEKVYYTGEELSVKIREKIKLDAIDLQNKILRKEKNNTKNFIFSNNISHV